MIPEGVEAAGTTEHEFYYFIRTPECMPVEFSPDFLDSMTEEIAGCFGCLWEHGGRVNMLGVWKSEERAGGLKCLLPPRAHRNTYTL